MAKYVKVPLPVVNAIVLYLRKQPWEEVDEVLTVFRGLRVDDDESAPLPPPSPSAEPEAA